MTKVRCDSGCSRRQAASAAAPRSARGAAKSATASLSVRRRPIAAFSSADIGEPDGPGIGNQLLLHAQLPEPLQTHLLGLVEVVTHVVAQVDQALLAGQ